VRVTATTSRPSALPLAPLAGLVLVVAATLALAGVAREPPEHLPLATVLVPVARDRVPVIVSVSAPVPPGRRASYRVVDGSGRSRSVPGAREVYLEASRITYADAARPFVIEADARLPYAVVDELLDALRAAGAHEVLLRARRR
jgi:hypothetical protein